MPFSLRKPLDVPEGPFQIKSCDVISGAPCAFLSTLPNRVVLTVMMSNTLTLTSWDVRVKCAGVYMFVGVKGFSEQT